ncbi:ABC transporter ATP-binding protein [Haloarcula halophila]|uniref:ABC transporter ATP-binding protein n=1 Tax=Haloarcula TaxID=2237 RepID=UPI0023E388BB|nr:ABC transporter ATP-binding protein [Halomicroarcula sp. DFY41]
MTNEGEDTEISLGEKFRAIYGVAQYRPLTAAGIIVLSLFAAVLEGVGLSFLIPVISLAQDAGDTTDMGRFGEVFVRAYEFVGIPFSLEAVIAGVAAVMVLRYTSSFAVSWLQASLRTYYARHLQTVGFENALDARIAYYDDHGSDEVLNAIVTQAHHAATTIQRSVKLIEQGLLVLMYAAVAVYLAPQLTLFTIVVLGGILYGFRSVLEAGYDVGDRVAEANERIQESVQAGVQGIREVKLYGLRDEIFRDFDSALGQFARSQIKLRRNQAMLENVYQMSTSVAVFGLIYVAIEFASMSLASLGMFLFAMFRLAPRVSTLNNTVYRLEGELPHLVRTQAFVADLQHKEELDGGTTPLPDSVDRLTFDGVDFSYDDERIFSDLSFDVERGEFIAFVGPSGAGKSTIAALIARLYDPDSGEIRADNADISEYDIAAWRDRLAVVQQNPYIFNDTLRYNLTLGNRNASRTAIQEACEVAQVSEFLDELPDGLDTVLGDDGVRLSGGQRQRVALARSLLKDGDVLVLDEATSDLDSTIEGRVHRAIENRDRDYAMIAIAHRLSTVINADRIYTLEDGHITEVGQHDDLLDYDGTYANMYDAQTTHDT